MSFVAKAPGRDPERAEMDEAPRKAFPLRGFEGVDGAEASILELVHLSDLARLPGVKGIRARLYHDAGIESVAGLGAWEPEALLSMLRDWVTRTGFPGTAPLPREVRFTIAKAKSLPVVVKG